MTEILQIRDKFLRLNNEQTIQIAAALVARRKVIDPDSLHIYDDQVNNILDQLSEQGINVTHVEEVDEVDETDKQKAQTLLAELYALAMSVPTDQKKAIFNKVQEFEQLLFGD